MRVLITGATGFVGGWLAEELARAWPDAELFGTVFGAAPADLPSGFPAAMRLVPCDLTDADAVDDLVRQARPDRAFHLAGFASAAGGDAGQVLAANVDATVHLLRALEREDSPCRVLLASSGYVYGATAPGRPARESDPPAPSGAYAESKAQMEAAARPFAGRAGLELTVTRAFNHTGPRQTTAFVVPAFARQIARIERGDEAPVVRVGNLEARRDFLDVRDVARAYRLLLEAPPAPWRVVNVASGVAVSIQDLLDRLVALSRTPLAVEPDPARMRPSDLAECVGNPALVESLTRWKPKIDMDSTLKETLDWWRAQENRRV